MKPIVIANWKMNETSQQAQALALSVVNGVQPEAEKIDVVICPPFTALGSIKDIPGIILGAQDIHWEDKGTFTGEISGPMLREFGCQYVIVGHSERRWKLQESDDIINKKLQAIIRNKFIPILCVGEQAEDRSDDRTQEVLEHQLGSAWRGIGRDDMASLIIAYEPVWAIGTGKVGSRVVATPEIVDEAYKYINGFLAKEEILDITRLIYGGSVDATNVGQFTKLETNQGFLVGGASLIAPEFIKIIKEIV